MLSGSKYLCILALIIVLASCPNDTEPSESRDKLKLSGKVYTREIGAFSLSSVFSGTIVVYAATNGDIAISDEGMGGAGHIKKGQLNYSIGKPAALMPLNPDDLELSAIEGIYSDVTLSSDGSNAAFLYLTPLDTDYDLLIREFCEISPPDTRAFPLVPITLQYGIVNYVYVDRNLTVSAQGSLSSYPLADLPINDFLQGIPFNLADNDAVLKANDIKLGLKKGWNAVHSALTLTITASLPLESLNPETFDIEDIEIDTIAGEIKVSIGNPESHKFTLDNTSSASEVYP